MAAKRVTWRGFAVILNEDESITQDKFSYAMAVYASRKQAECRREANGAPKRVVRVEVKIVAGVSKRREFISRGKV